MNILLSFDKCIIILLTYILPTVLTGWLVNYLLIKWELYKTGSTASEERRLVPRQSQSTACIRELQHFKLASNIPPLSQHKVWDTKFQVILFEFSFSVKLKKLQVSSRRGCIQACLRRGGICRTAVFYGVNDSDGLHMCDLYGRRGADGSEVIFENNKNKK